MSAAVVWALLCAGVLALGGVGLHAHSLIPELGAAGVGGILWLARGLFLARFRKANWLVRATDNGLYVKFRSYLNAQFSREDLIVVFLPYREISVARLVRERLELPDLSTRGGVSIQFRQRVELELTRDVAALTASVAEESARRGPSTSHWYGSSSVKYQHQPVSIDGTRLSLVWECVPRATSFLDALKRYVRIDEPQSSKQSYQLTAGNSPSAENDRRIAELARSGQVVAAIALARTVYSCGLMEARTRVESLVRNGAADKPAA